MFGKFDFHIEDRKYFFTVSLILVILLTILLGAVVIYRANNAYARYFDIIKTTQSAELLHVSDAIEFKIREIFIEAELMSRDKNIYDLLHGVAAEKDRQHITDRFKDVAALHENYDQLRILSLSGDEIIRINKRGGVVEIVPEKELQNKSDRYYFKEILKLGGREIYISKFDLNIEHGEIEVPYQPTIRIGKVICDDESNICGLVLFNYYGKELLLDLDNHRSEGKGNLMLVNAQGYWMKNDYQEKEWGFMFEDMVDIKFSNEYPDEWKEAKLNYNGQFETENGLFTYRWVYPMVEYYDILSSEKELDMPENVYDYKWLLVDHISTKALQEQYLDGFYDVSKGMVVLWVMGVIICFSVGIVVESNKSYHERMIHYASKDELTGQFNRRAGFSIMKKQLEISMDTIAPLTIAFIDVNDLKMVNDKYGHDEGDWLLQTVCELIDFSKRANDLLIRLGGDEFVMMMPNCDIKHGEKAFERILNNIEAFNEGSGKSFAVSISFGFSEYDPKINQSLDQLVDEADKRMYDYKKKFKADRLKNSNFEGGLQ